MKIEKITQAISTAARARGYKSVAVCKQGQKQTSGEYPRVQVSTPTLRQKSGTNNGIVTLRTEVTLCRLAESPHPTDDDSEVELEQLLYDDALAIIEAIDALSCVCEVKCTAESTRAKVTPYGDATLTICIDTKIKYRK
ncbi:MAG: hypothetical protein IKV60_01590 [Rikenellaceae bacterium]|nr:hypothetical protein [Rikenellaceae bacterium]